MPRCKRIVARRADGTVVEGWKPQRGAVERRPGERGLLAWFLKLTSMPEPEDDRAWSRLAHEMYGFYRRVFPASPPLLEDAERLRWAREVFSQVRVFLQGCLNSLREKEHVRASLSVPYEWGASRFQVRGTRLVPYYETYDPAGRMMLALANALMEVDDLSRIRPCRCGALFYKMKRRQYCSAACKMKAHPSQERQKDFRVRRAVWDSCKKELEKALEGARTLHRITESQALQNLETIYRKAQHAFEDAFRRKKEGLEYEAGKQLLTQSAEQLKRLRKKVKGF